MRRALLLLLCAATTMLAVTACEGSNSPAATGIGSGSGGYVQPSGEADAVRSKLEALMADECFAKNPAAVYPHCAKYMTELAGTVGTVQNAVAATKGADPGVINELRKGINQYQSRNCDTLGNRPSKADAAACTAAVKLTARGILDSFHALYR
ncbi:MAG: hypothetical protein ACRDRL_23895 [Sciscionella sp.]